MLLDLQVVFDEAPGIAKRIVQYVVGVPVESAAFRALMKDIPAL